MLFPYDIPTTPYNYGMMVIQDTLGELLGDGPSLVLAALLSGLAILFTSQVFLHPLRKYPGPIAAKFTDAYNGFYTAQRRLHLVTWQNHLRYGPVVRQGPNKLVFSTITAVHDIYRTDKTTKPQAYKALGPSLTTYNVFTATDNQLHRQRRQLVGQILTDASLRAFEPTMIKQVDVLLANLLRSAQKPTSASVDMSEETRRLGLDIAGQLAFGYDLKLQTEEKNRFMLTMITKGTFWSSVFLHYPGGRRFRMALVAVKAFRQLREPYFALMQTMINSRMAEEVDAKHDLFSRVAPALRSEGDNAGGLRDSELWAEANLFLTAAGDTVKTALSGVLFYLARDERVYKKLAAEIGTVFKNGGEITGPGLVKCKYLRACIDESLRMSPPAAGILWREQAPDPAGQPFIVDGHVIPRGTIVGVNVYSLHHNEEYFPNSFEYYPERWSDEQDADTKRRMREAFMPFSVGPRGCAGKSMAYSETGLVIAKILWYFDFETTRGGMGKVGGGDPHLGAGRERPGEFQLYDVFSAMHEGPYLTFKTREEYWKELVQF
ncbi:cytochrome P450 [Xylaria intraflava]|nr:cytochrome P450 [Xylaria intraflava]